MNNTIEIKCIMDSNFCKGNTWYKVYSVSDKVVYVYFDKHEMVGLPKCHFDMENIKVVAQQEKVMLKVGDMLKSVVSRGGKGHIITSFSKHKIITANGLFWVYPFLNKAYYVNGKLYARENIIVPDFKEEEKVEYQEITKDNIVAVLEYNKSLGLKIDDIHIKHEMICYTDNSGKIGYNSEWDLCTNWLAHIEIDLGKLKPLPKANPFDAVKVGQWVKFINNQSVGGDLATQNKWYEITQKSGNGISYYSNNKKYAYSNYSPNWDLTDIRDYNPTECELKIGDVINFGVFGDLSIDEFDYIDENIITNLGGSLICRGFKRFHEYDNKLVNGKAYDKVIIPPFDFAQCLVDAGFTLDGGNGLLGYSLNNVYVFNISDNCYFGGKEIIDKSPANAKIIIEMAKLAQQLT